MIVFHCQLVCYDYNLWDCISSLKRSQENSHLVCSCWNDYRISKKNDLQWTCTDKNIRAHNTVNLRQMISSSRSLLLSDEITYWLRTSLRTTKIWREKKEKPTLPMNNNFCSDIWIRIWRKQTERPSNHVSTVKNAVCGVMIYIFLVYIRKLLPIDYHVKTSSYIASVGEYVFTLWLQYSHNQRISNWTDTYGMWWKGWSASWNGCRPM